MLSPKSLALSLLLVLACAQAQAARLVCETSSRHSFFSAELDSSNFATTEFFDLTDAELRVEFAVASRLSCAGHSLSDDLSCVGHWFGLPGNAVEFAVRNENGQLRGRIHNLARAADPAATTGEHLQFVCQVE